jgi:hypothetical protein
MRQTILLLTAGAVLVLVAGCIVNDQITTITVQPDGSADWIRLQSNIHSTEKGAKGAEELKRFIEEFDSHKDADYVHITEAGGEVLEARWVRREEPYATLVTARFPNWTALQSFGTFKNEKGEVIAQAHFTQKDNRRKLSIVAPVPKDDKRAEEANPTMEQLRQEQANGISETRVVVAGGRIIASQGFAVASDKRSALLDPAAIQKLVQSATDKVEIFLEWELADN